MRRVLAAFVLLGLLLAVPVVADNKDDIPIVEPDNTCSYCGQLNQCGCPRPPQGYYLSFSCTCGSGGATCERTCEYTPL